MFSLSEPISHPKHVSHKVRLVTLRPNGFNAKKCYQYPSSPLKIYIYRNNSPFFGTVRKEKDPHFREIKHTVETGIAPSPKSLTPPRSPGPDWAIADRRQV